MSHPADVAATMRHAADQLEHRDSHRDPVKDHGYGGAVYVLLHYAAQELHAAPAIEVLRRHLDVQQLQHANGTCADLVKALRECADEVDDGALVEMSELRATAAYYALQEQRRELMKALGWDDLTMPGSTVAREAAERIRRLGREVERMKDERDRARGEAHAAVGRRDKVESTVRRVEMVKFWTNEDGKRFVFADDLYAAMGYEAAS